MFKYLCYKNVNSVILTQFSCDLLYVLIPVQSFTLFVGKIALMDMLNMLKIECRL